MADHTAILNQAFADPYLTAEQKAYLKQLAQSKASGPPQSPLESAPNFDGFHPDGFTVKTPSGNVKYSPGVEPDQTLLENDAARKQLASMLSTYERPYVETAPKITMKGAQTDPTVTRTAPVFGTKAMVPGDLDTAQWNPDAETLTFGGPNDHLPAVPFPTQDRATALDLLDLSRNRVKRSESQPFVSDFAADALPLAQDYFKQQQILRQPALTQPAPAADRNGPITPFAPNIVVPPPAKKKINQSVALGFYQAAGGDKEKARKLALDAGYTLE